MTLRSNTIHYLDPEVIQNYANVVLISKNGERLRCNSLILAACKSALVYSFNPDDETHYIITEFSEIGEKLAFRIRFQRHTHFEKSNFCPKIQFWQNPNIFTSFSPKYFLTIFLVKSKFSTAKKSKTTTFSQVFHPKKSIIFSGNQSWIFRQKMKIWRFE